MINALKIRVQHAIKVNSRMKTRAQHRKIPSNSFVNRACTSAAKVSNNQAKYEWKFSGMGVRHKQTKRRTFCLSFQLLSSWNFPARGDVRAASEGDNKISCCRSFSRHKSNLLLENFSARKLSTSLSLFQVGKRIWQTFGRVKWNQQPSSQGSNFGNCIKLLKRMSWRCGAGMGERESFKRFWGLLWKVSINDCFQGRRGWNIVLWTILCVASLIWILECL